MDKIERRALYHSLRMNWLHDPTLQVESWQVEDYPALPLTALFGELKQFGIQLERVSFIAYADACDSPEELAEQLIGDRHLPSAEEDRIYLLLFELWRRLLPEKPSLSLLGFALDQQIDLYDSERLDDFSSLNDLIKKLIQVLDDNADEGLPPVDVFHSIAAYCAHDLARFLYDFLSDQIDTGHELEAQELLSDLDPYLGPDKWFQLLRLRLSAYGGGPYRNAQRLIEELLEEQAHHPDLDHALEFLAILNERDDRSLFPGLVKRLIPLIQEEEELEELLALALEYFERIHQAEPARLLRSVLERYPSHLTPKRLTANHPDLLLLSSLFDRGNASPH